MVCGVVLCQEPVAGSLEQLWLSYNMVEKLKGVTVLKNLKVKGKALAVNVKVVRRAAI